MGMDFLDAADLALGLLDPAIALADRYAFLNDPLLLGGVEQAIANYNNVAGASPYGSPGTSWNGMFGWHADGTPVGYGEAQAYMLNDMMRTDPSQSAIANYQSLLGMQRPGMVDETAGLAGLLGRGGGFPQGGYTTPSFNLQTTQMPHIPQTGDVYRTQTPAANNLTGDPWQGGGILESIFGGGGGSTQPTGGTSQPTGGGSTQPSGGVQNPYGSFNGAWFSGGGNSGAYSPATPTNANLPWLKSAAGVNATQIQPSPVSQVKSSASQWGSQGGYTQDQLRAIVSAAHPQDPNVIRALGSSSAGQGNTQPPQYPSPQTTQQPAVQKAQTPTAQSAYGYGAAPQAFQSYLANPMADVNAARSTMASGPYGQLMANPQSFTPQVIQDLLRTGETDINQQAMGQRRQMLEAAAPGTSGGGVMGRQLFDLESGRQNAMTQLGRDVRTQAALQNFQDLMGASGLQSSTEQSLAGLGLQGRQGAASLQLGAEQALSQQQAAGNQMRQQMYNTDFTNMGRAIDSVSGLQNEEMARRMQLMQQLQGLGQQDMALQQSLLDRIMQMEAARLQPSPVSQMPSTAGYGGYGGYSGSGGQDWSGALLSASGLMGQYFGQQRPSLWV